MFILILFSFLLQSQDIIKYPEKLPINNQEVIEHLKKKEQPQLLGDEYWDDDRILFSTYFGGSGYDCINDGAFDSKGNFIQVGYTGSPDLPIVGDAFQKEKNLNHDMFIVKWNPEGDVIWSTFLGGSLNEIQSKIVLDENGYIYMGGTTGSTGANGKPNISLPTKENALMTHVNKFTQDGQYVTVYISKFTPEGKYIWGTYFGNDLWNITEVLTGIDVYKDEIAFSWDLGGYRLHAGKHQFAIVTEDAEQKTGVIKAGSTESEGWQTQVFKIDTAGTTLKY